MSVGLRLLSRLLALAALCAALLTGAAAARASEGPTQVTVGFFLTSLSGVSPADGSFRFTAYVWFLDPGGAFDPLSQAQFLSRDYDIRQDAREVMEDGAVYTLLRVDATVDHRYDLRNFPFDRQSLRIPLETPLTADRLVLAPDRDGATAAEILSLNEWDVTSLSLHEAEITYPTAFGKAESKPFSRLYFQIELERKRSPLVLEKFIGYMMSLLIIALVYLVPNDMLAVRVGMITSAILTAVGNRYGLDAQIGAEANLGLIDQLSLIVFAAVFSALAVSLTCYRLQLERTAEAARRANKLSGIVLVTASFALSFAAIVSARG